MNYGDRLRDTVIPEMQGSTAKGCRAGNFPVVGFLSLEGDTRGKGSSQPLASHKPKVQSNDIVEFDKQPGTWEVVAPVNGSKADVRRSGGFDTRIVTARLESLIVVRRAGSPGYSY
jgi:hypothetical protein